ncbi:hypothetical protein HHK36_019755 [Tetracentron sinense]|uniref:Uncharacterized protein n=1 Tax=Tetracentron sinense TaxID=13715 RepID=A0A834YZM7_TETSI|nr:hypothetical protein HHK36_019755 [Tetracentron sinense]
MPKSTRRKMVFSHNFLNKVEAYENISHKPRIYFTNSLQSTTLNPETSEAGTWCSIE